MQYSKKVTLTFNGRKLVELADDLYIKSSLTMFIIPKGFKTDLASIPRPLWWFIAPTDWGILVPAIMHDYFYRDATLPREMADFLFKEKMKDFGMGFIKRNLAYFAVRLFGGQYYGN
jgi:hypothetical protein